MKILKIAVLPVSLLLFLVLGGCATTMETVSRDPKSGAAVLKKEASYGTEYTIQLFQMVSPSVPKKITVLLPIVAGKDMVTKKTPNATEKAVAEAVYASLKGELANKSILAERGDGGLNLDLKVHYVYTWSLPTINEYFGRPWSRNLGGKILVVRGTLSEKGRGEIAQMDFIDNEGNAFSYQRLTDRVSLEITNQIEKILKEGVNVGKSP